MIRPTTSLRLATLILTSATMVQPAGLLAQQSATVDTTARLTAARELGAIKPTQEVQFGEVAIPRNTTSSTQSCFYFADPAKAPGVNTGDSVTALGCERISGVSQMGRMSVSCTASEFAVATTTSVSTPGLGTSMSLFGNPVNAVIIEGEVFDADTVRTRRFKCGSDVIIQLNPVLLVTDVAKPTASTINVGTITLSVAFF